ncbi:MAG: DEAD/DEAH box helicase [Phycisphaerales bacterium]|nr:DEAD/DEAH box helicase [Phycisphaerales bacterium]MCB9863666.1 DEAD/DEAH box helicase [Phycisphaerales bacterium]
MTRDEICEKFLDSLEFDLYAYQEEALLAWFEEEGGVLVCAPTGMGKTLLAEAAVFEALCTRQRLYYTTPLIALTDQKFRELQDKAEAWGFSRDDVGLITGNRRENSDAIVRVVVAEILLNHLLSPDPELSGMDGVHAVVMDEFHSFNDRTRGIVWELSLTLLPKHVRVLLLSATVGNPNEFATWLHASHGRKLRVILSNERRVPLTYQWVEDKLMTDLLTDMTTSDDATNRSPALVFCFNRDECWDVAEKLKGQTLISADTKASIEAFLDERREDLIEGVGPKLRQMLVRGVAVHHAGLLPKHKDIVESLFQRKWIPFVICTETLAAGINLPARSVVLGTLIKGKQGDKKLIPSATAHQIFGRAGRPQFDKEGFVFAIAHEDDVKINKWRTKYEQLDLQSKHPSMLQKRKDLERKKPSRRKTQQYWSEGQLRQLVEAGPAKLYSRSMISYQVLIYLLTKFGSLADARAFVEKRFNDADRIASYQEQLGFMLENLAGLGYLSIAEDGLHVTLNDSIHKLLNFRSIDPLFGAYLAEQLVQSNDLEKQVVLEALLETPPGIWRHMHLRPGDLEPGPLQTNVMEPLMIHMGIKLAGSPANESEEEKDEYDDPRDDPWWDGETVERPPTLPDMLRIAFEAQLKAPEPIYIQAKHVTPDLFDDCDFYRFVRSRNLIKQEGLLLRLLLRLVTLSEEFATLTEDPAYRAIGEKATQCCMAVDPSYTDHFLADLQEVRNLAAAL